LIQHSKPWITHDDQQAVRQVLTNGLIAKGSITKKFEQALSDYFEVDSVVTCGSGTLALVLALKGLGVGRGDEVILPTYVCQSVATAIQTVFATPVYCDVGENWVLSADNIVAKLSLRTKAIIVVHQFGIAADIPAIKNIGIPVIEDCCQAFGTKHENKLAGTAGAIGIFSFSGIKCLTAGEGGALLTKDQHILQRLMEASVNNWSSIAPMSDLQSALAMNQLNRYNKFLSQRRVIAEKYINAFPQAFVQDMITVSSRTIYYRFLLRQCFETNFEKIKEWFAQKGIAVRQGVDTLLHRTINLPDSAFPVATRCFEQTLSIPVYPGLTIKEQEKIIRVTNEWLSGHSK
jgi:UDP-4-amino-4-deoxy-L-arabinose-oxoglutarate aminotransferase